MNSAVFRRARAFRGLVGISMLALSGVAMSAPALIGTKTNASGIDGVVVDSVTYDVTFSTSSFDSTFSTPGGAGDASKALAADLNTLSVAGLGFGGASGFHCGANPPGFSLCTIYAGASSGSEAAAFVGPGSLVWTGGLLVGGGNLSPGCPQKLTALTTGCLEAAHWTKETTGVPEPATLALFGLGLAGVGLSGRRRARCART